MVCGSCYIRRWHALAYLLLNTNPSQPIRPPGMPYGREQGTWPNSYFQTRTRHYRSDPIDEVIADSDWARFGDRIFYGAPGKRAYINDNTSVDVAGATYSVSHPDLTSTGRLVEEIEKIEFVTDHKFRVPTATGYLRISLDVEDHLALVNKVVTEINRLAKRGGYSPTQSQNQFVKSIGQSDNSTPSIDGVPIQGWNTIFSPMFVRTGVERDHILATAKGGLADKDNPKYDSPGGGEMSGAFKYTAEDFLTMDFATEALRLQAQRCLSRSRSSKQAFQSISIGKRTSRSLGWSLANTALGIGSLVAAAVIDGKVTSQSKRFDAMSLNMGGIVSRMNKFASAIPNMARAIGRRMTLPLNLNVARIDQTQVLSLIHALVSMACRQSESYVHSLDFLAQGKVPVSLFERQVWEKAFTAFKTKMASIKLIPVMDDPSIIFRASATTLVVEEKGKDKLRIAVPIPLTPEEDYPYTVYRMQPSIILLGGKPFYLEADTFVVMRPDILPLELRPQDLSACEKPYMPMFRVCRFLPEGRNTSCLSDILQRSSRAECSHLLRTIDASKPFIKMSDEGRTLVYSSTPVTGEIVCPGPSSGNQVVTIGANKPSKFRVLPPCKLVMGGQTLTPKTFDQEVELESHPDPKRELTLAAAQMINGVERLLNKQQSSKSVSQLYDEMVSEGYNDTNLEEYLSADPVFEAYEEVSGSLTPHLPLWVSVLTSVFLIMTFLALIGVIWDSCNKRRARKERDSNRARFVEASRLRNMDTEDPNFVNLMRLL